MTPEVNYPETHETHGHRVSVPMGVLISAISVLLDSTIDPSNTNIDLPVSVVANIIQRLSEPNAQARAADFYIKYLGDLLNGDKPTTT